MVIPAERRKSCKIMEIDLNKPAFGKDSQKIESPAENQPADSLTKIDEEGNSGDSVEEQKVPYSRFKKFHEEAKQYRQEAEEWRAKAEELEKTRVVESPKSDLPSYWEKLYGDSPESQEAWKIQQQINEQLKQEARVEAINAVREERFGEEKRVKENIEQIDEQFEDLSAFVGRDLTDQEQSSVLDIIDEYTPKDKDGDYLGAILPAEKAWEIYELKNQASKAPKQKSRDNIASLSGSHSQGETNIAEKDKNFNPLDWGAWRNRI